MSVPRRSLPSAKPKYKQQRFSSSLPLQGCRLTRLQFRCAQGSAELAEKQLSGLHRAAPSAVHLAATSSCPVLQKVAHELRLQFVSTTLATNMHRAFLHCQFFVPWRQMHHRHCVIAKRAPHDPPAVAGAFQYPAIRAGATAKRTRNET